LHSFLATAASKSAPDLSALRRAAFFSCIALCGLAPLAAWPQNEPDPHADPLSVPIAQLQADPQWRVYAAVITHDHKTLQALLDGGDSPNRFSVRYRSPLVMACQIGDLDAVKILLRGGAKIDLSDTVERFRFTWDESALTKAIQTNHIGIVQYLLSQGAQVNLRGPLLGETPVFVALRERNEDILNLLLQAHADLNVRNNNGYTPLMLAAMNNDLDMVEFLQARGAKFDSPKDELLFAASHGDVAGIQRILASSGPARNGGGKLNLVNASSKDGFTPLMAAASQGQTATVKALIAAGADLNVLNSAHDTALLLAIRNGHKSTILALLDAGADPKILDGGGGTTLLQAALYMDDPDIVHRLIAAGVSTSSVGVEANGSPNLNTPLMIAASKGAVHTVQILLDAHVDVNARRFEGATALMDAASSGQAEIVTMLLRAGADPSIKDKNGKTAMDYASETSQNDVIAILQIRSAPPSSTQAPPKR
jgi:uncharacterized protein